MVEQYKPQTRCKLKYMRQNHYTAKCLHPQAAFSRLEIFRQLVLQQLRV